jgi:CheY-like chemotaxis protein
VLLVRIAPPVSEQIPADVFTRVQSGREALELLKLLRFGLLLASRDLPDMQPWELFERARRTQARLQCALVDDRLTLDDERRIRQAGAAVFGANDPMLHDAIVRLLPAKAQTGVPRHRSLSHAPP